MPDVPYTMLPVGRLSFAKIRELQYSDEDVEKKNGKYSFNLIFPADADLSELKNAIKDAAVERFKDKADVLRKKGTLKLPIKSGDTMLDANGALYDGYENDSQVLSVGFYQPMPFMDQFKRKFESNSPEAEEAFYSGCYVQVAVTVHGYGEIGGQRGTGVRLQCFGLLKRKEGEPFKGVGHGDPEDLFSDFEAEAPTMGDVVGTQTDNGEEW